ncbi:MAG: D-cysteine desulfhydrase family protein [Anaerolineales bacterium]|nr:D-cysteine desulfhydrase family protein [Anaerolineales bacterium]
MNLDVVPRISLAALPTPVQPLANLSRDLGRKLWIKRDDLTGLALGGNKTRKLEFLCADALRAGADTLITTGAPQSNHCRQTAAAAAALGLRCVLVLAGSPQPADTGNLLLDALVGAELRWAGDTERDSALHEAYSREQSAGRKPYRIPYGGSNPLGAIAYAAAVRELLDQDIRPDWIIFASSSGGTQAGLTLGARWFGLKSRILGVSVDLQAAPLRRKVHALAAETVNTVRIGDAVPEESILVDDRFLGGGYGKAGALECDAIRLFARREAILLDPVYTGRAAGGMLEMIRRGEIGESESILFWHTGGTPALWAYAKEIGGPRD